MCRVYQRPPRLTAGRRLRRSEGWYHGGMTTEQAGSLITIDPDVMSGAPVFRGTRVPVQTLFEYLAAGDPLEEFLDGFPSVS